jgi:hypothetical protein
MLPICKIAKFESQKSHVHIWIQMVKNALAGESSYMLMSIVINKLKERDNGYTFVEWPL